jgi:flagellar basal-body rod modification protein FlgD
MTTFSIASTAGRPVQAVNGSSAGGSAQSPSNSGLPGVDGSEFMQILLAQLRHQNPMEPMDDKELIGQMTQLNSLQELQKISATLDGLVKVLTPKDETGEEEG